MLQNPDGGEPTLLPEGSDSASASHEGSSEQVTAPANGDGVEPTPAAPDGSVPSSVSNESTTEPETANAFPGTPYTEIPDEAQLQWEQTSGGGTPPPGNNDSGSGSDDSGGHEPEPGEMHRMSFFDHLEELRTRIFYSLISIAGGTLVGWVYRDEIFAGLARPITTILLDMKMNPKLVYTNPTGPFNLYMKLAMIAGVFMASPFILYQAWKFISPGLYHNEKKYALPFILFCSLLFISGGAFAYYMAFPAALRFLLDFSKQFTPMVTVDEYAGLAATVILGLAVVFELPVLILFLTLFRLMTPGFLLRNFRYAFLIIVIIAAAVTPTSDIVNMMIFAAPLMGLYFLGIGLSYLVLRARGKRKDKDSKDDES